MTGYMGFFLKGDILCFDTLSDLETDLSADFVEKGEVMLSASPGQIVFIEGRMNWESMGFLGMAFEIIEE